MDEIRVGIISEGLPDQWVIQKIIKTEFPDRTFIFTNISPTEDEIDANAKKEGFGWGGVYKVCKNLNEKLEILQTTGLYFDILVIHIDGDVMMLTYESTRITKEAEDAELPCYSDDATITDNCNCLRKVVESWCRNKEQQEVYCIPYINSDVWVAYVLYEKHRTFITQELTKEALVHFLLRRTKREGKLIRMHDGEIKKVNGTYRTAADAITTDLIQEMKAKFSQMHLFCDDLSRVLYSPE